MQSLDLLVEVGSLLEPGRDAVFARRVTVPDFGLARLGLGLELLLPLALLGVVRSAKDVGSVECECSDRRRDVRSCVIRVSGQARTEKMGSSSGPCGKRFADERLTSLWRCASFHLGSSSSILTWSANSSTGTC